MNSLRNWRSHKVICIGDLQFLLQQWGSLWKSGCKRSWKKHPWQWKMIWHEWSESGCAFYFSNSIQRSSFTFSYFSSFFNFTLVFIWIWTLRWCYFGNHSTFNYYFGLFHSIRFVRKNNLFHNMVDQTGQGWSLDHGQSINYSAHDIIFRVGEIGKNGERR